MPTDMKMCVECKESQKDIDWKAQSCEHCDICGTDGVSKDPRFQHGGWCEVCQRKYELAEAEWYENNDSSNMEDGATPWWDAFEKMVNKID
tara:strand:- start:491 stop:763 length:273 start_codon:yes stop_codon:yes gene_type:complete